ncbi:hypothetical protein SAMN06265373_102327 [Shimia sagamensis]|uniref:Uncharacterized protein n=1 Tax=Shimia sagamensis TaxID=1566352 RepID=A0ABY1NLP3_9RHOB|nr:hypothetical protein SAMN06265373_102327 [Shimia sagamensis]
MGVGCGGVHQGEPFESFLCVAELVSNSGVQPEMGRSFVRLQSRHSDISCSPFCCSVVFVSEVQQRSEMCNGVGSGWAECCYKLHARLQICKPVALFIELQKAPGGV